MKIKKFEAQTEQTAIEKVKAELGLSALILSIKKTQPKGFFKFFKKATVEVTAAFDDKSAKQEPVAVLAETKNYFAQRLDASKQKEADKKTENEAENKSLYTENDRLKDLEAKLLNAEGMLDKAMSQLSIKSFKPASDGRKYENSLLQMFYDSLTDQGVHESLAECILEDISFVDDELDLTTAVKIVYNKIITILQNVDHIEPKKAKNGKPLILAFIGPTGVGKTTTIAKLSSQFMLQKKLSVGFITADTYRIAAVEQLKTYAEILGINISVVYNNDDLQKSIEKMSKTNDVIMIDTAGRSHKNLENLEELKLLLDVIPDSKRLLTLSTTTKSEDLIAISKAYSDFTDYTLIFTKLDETACLGSLLNVCHQNGKHIAYLTNGQNVPEDIEKIRPEKIARALMGLGGVSS